MRYPVLLLALSFLGAAPPPPQPPQDRPPAEKNPYVERFNELDRNQDDFVTLDEWPLEPASFHRVDRDQDGRLSRAELLTPNSVRGRRLDALFRQLDLNRDGRLSRTEWRPVGSAFERRDLDDNGYITRDEMGNLPVPRENAWRPGSNIGDQQEFRNLDRDKDNRLSRRELSGPRFDRLDRNRDGVVSPNEW